MVYFLLFSSIQHGKSGSGNHTSGFFQGEPQIYHKIGIMGIELSMFERRKRTPFGSLVEQLSGLVLHILTIGIGEQVFPNHTLLGKPPDPYFFSGFVIVSTQMSETEIIIAPVASEEIAISIEYVIRLIPSEIILLVSSNIPSLVDWKITDLSIVSDIGSAWINKLQVAAGFSCGVHPVVIGNG